MGLFGTNVKALKQRGDVGALLTIIETKSGKSAARAMEALHELDEGSVSLLNAELRAEAPFRAAAAAFALTTLCARGSMAAKLSLLSYVRDSHDPFVAGIALDSLAQESNETLPDLTDAVIAFLDGPACLLECPRDPAVVAGRPETMSRQQVMDEFAEQNREPRTIQLLAAFKIIENCEEPRAIPFLARALAWRDPTNDAYRNAVLKSGGLLMFDFFEPADGDVRAAAAIALGSTGNLAAMDALIAALEDESGSVRRSALESLGRVCLANGTGETACHVLPLLKQFAIVPDAHTTLDVNDPFYRRTFAPVREAACFSIAMLNDLGGSVVLGELMADDNELVREAAADGLRRWQQLQEDSR